MAAIRAIIFHCSSRQCFLGHDHSMDASEIALLAKMIDHSVLNPTWDRARMENEIETAVRYRVASVCILPFALAWCAEKLEGSGVFPTTTVGFPHGGNRTSVKVAEAEAALVDGAEELDMVVNINRVLSEEWEEVRADIQAVMEVVHGSGKKVKVIFENCYLEDRHKIRLCQISSELRVDWVKTSTGYGTGGASDEDLILMRRHSAPEVQVKAAGGVRDLDRLLHVRSLGVTRVGATATAAILEAAARQLEASAF